MEEGSDHKGKGMGIPGGRNTIYTKFREDEKPALFRNNFLMKESSFVFWFFVCLFLKVGIRLGSSNIKSIPNKGAQTVSCRW